VSPNPVSRLLLISAGVAALAGTTIFFLLRSSTAQAATTGAWTEIHPPVTLEPGVTYRMSMTAEAGATEDDVANGPIAGWVDSSSEAASTITEYGSTVPADWPSTDTDPTRWRFEFTYNAHAGPLALTDLPAGARFFAKT
jgi:hypothetical protein